ncbi:MAG: hypothetical protein HC906_04790 [Bacteroidales bacterium]|nr:hypothetical protein [Bacteroidales bacterium]
MGENKKVKAQPATVLILASPTPGKAFRQSPPHRKRNSRPDRGIFILWRLPGVPEAIGKSISLLFHFINFFCLCLSQPKGNSIVTDIKDYKL